MRPPTRCRCATPSRCCSSFRSACCSTRGCWSVEPWAVLATVLVIVIGKSIAAWVIVRAFGHSLRTALLISVSLAQIGEFSFILAALGVSLGLLSPAARDLDARGGDPVDPAESAAVHRARSPAGRARACAARRREPGATRRAITSSLVGHGRVGRRIAAELRHGSQPLLVIESRREVVDEVERETMTGAGRQRGRAGRARSGRHRQRRTADRGDSERLRGRADRRPRPRGERGAARSSRARTPMPTSSTSSGSARATSSWASARPRAG